MLSAYFFDPRLIWDKAREQAENRPSENLTALPPDMTDKTHPPTQPVPARVRKTNVFTSVVWLIPLIALFAGGWLLMQNIRKTGPEITLLMDSADGIEVNNTVIKSAQR